MGTRRRHRLLAGVAVGVILAVSSVRWLWRHPDQSFPGGYGMTVQRQVGSPIWTTLLHSGTPGADAVRVISLEPRIRTDGTEAVIQYVICELDPETLSAERVSGFGYGLRAQDLDRFCTHIHPAEGATFQLRSQPPQELLLGVTPTRPGRTVISGHRMAFRVGWRVGTEEIDVDVTLVGRPAAD